VVTKLIIILDNKLYGCFYKMIASNNLINI